MVLLESFPAVTALYAPSTALNRLPMMSRFALISHAVSSSSTTNTRTFCPGWAALYARSEEHTSELQSRPHLVCRLLLEKKKIEDLDEPLERLTHDAWAHRDRTRELERGQPLV